MGRRRTGTHGAPTPPLWRGAGLFTLAPMTPNTPQSGRTRLARAAVHRGMRGRTAPLALVALALLLLLPSPASAAGDWPWPVDGDVLTHYRNGGDPFAAGQHRGIDIAGEEGHPVRAATPGTVRYAGSLGSSGLLVSIRTADGRFDTSYLHLSSIDVRRGAEVSAGDRIGAVGVTGQRSVEAPHLHFGVRVAGTDHDYRDPLELLAARATEDGTPPRRCRCPTSRAPSRRRSTRFPRPERLSRARARRRSRKALRPSRSPHRSRAMPRARRRRPVRPPPGRARRRGARRRPAVARRRWRRRRRAPRPRASSVRSRLTLAMARSLRRIGRAARQPGPRDAHTVRRSQPLRRRRRARTHRRPDDHRGRSPRSRVASGLARPKCRSGKSGVSLPPLGGTAPPPIGRPATRVPRRSDSSRASSRPLSASGLRRGGWPVAWAEPALRP